MLYSLHVDIVCIYTYSYILYAAKYAQLLKQKNFGLFIT